MNELAIAAADVTTPQETRIIIAYANDSNYVKHYRMLCVLTYTLTTNYMPIVRLNELDRLQ